MSASKNINAEKIQGNLNVNGLSATTVNVNDNYSLPNTAGTDGQVLTINGSGGVEWSSVTKTTLNVSIGTNDQIPFMNSTPNDFDYSNDLIFDGSKLRVTNGGDYVDIFNGGTIEFFGVSRGMSIGGTSSGSKIQSNLHNSDLLIYANNDKQLYLKYNNPYVGINQNSPTANLHIISTVNTQPVFLVENSVGQKLFEVTSDNKVKISDSYTMPSTPPVYGNVIVSDGAGDTTWGEFPLDPRWYSSDVNNGDYSIRGRITSYNYAGIELNYTGNTNNPNTYYSNIGGGPTRNGVFVLGGGNTFGTASSTPGVGSIVNIGTGNTHEGTEYGGVVVGDDNIISSLTTWESMFPGYTFKQSSYGYPASAGSNYSSSAYGYFLLGDNSKMLAPYNGGTVLGSNNTFYGAASAFIGRNNSGYTKVDTLNEIHNIASSFVMGNDNMMGWSDQILMGFNTTTVGTNSAPGIFFGYGPTGDTANPSAGFVHGPDVNSNSLYPVNFAMGGVDVFNSANTTTSILQDGSGSGIFYLYRDSSTVEPSANMPTAVALFAKESPRGVVGLAVKDELGTYNLFSDTVSIGFTGGTAMLEVKGKGDTDSTDALNIKNSNGDVGLRITDGLNVYIPNLPITQGGLSAGGLYIDTSTNTIKVV